MKCQPQQTFFAAVHYTHIAQSLWLKAITQYLLIILMQWTINIGAYKKCFLLQMLVHTIEWRIQGCMSKPQLRF